MVKLAYSTLTFPQPSAPVLALGLRPGTGQDQRAEVITALGLLLNGGVLTLAPGTYVFSKYVPMLGFRGITVEGRGAIIQYPSADTTLVADGTAQDDTEARSAFLVMSSEGITFRGIEFQGSSTEAIISKNAGSGVHCRRVTAARVQGCKLYYGSNLFSQNNYAEDLGAQVLENEIYGFRNAMTIGSQGVIAHNRFTQPTDAGFDRTNPSGVATGSSHGIYLFAGRDSVIVDGNILKNVRVTGIKISGSTQPIRNMLVSKNILDDCGNGITWGADDTQEHSNAVISDNEFYNNATNRAGWNDSVALQVYGCKSVAIQGNSFHYNRDCDGSASVSAIRAIQVSRYTTGSSAVENVLIEGNQFYGDVRSGKATSPAAILTHLIDVQEVGAGSDFDGSAVGHGTLVIRGNVAKTVGSDFINAVRCTGLVVDSNEMAGMLVWGTLRGCRMPRFSNNVVIPNLTTSGNASLKMVNCSFPILFGNYSMDRALGLGGGKGMNVGDNNGGSTPVDFPLLGVTGRHRSSEGRQEIVMAFGDGWEDGDTVVIDGNTFTYKGTAPGAGEFNDAATLIALIDALANYTCVDYGATWSITTNHLWIRRATASASADQYNVAVTAVHPCAGVLLTNGGASLAKCYSRGGEAAGPGTLVVVWSPMAHMWSNVRLDPDEATAVTLLTASAPPWVASRVDRHSGSNLVVTVPAVAGTESFRWSLT